MRYERLFGLGWNFEVSFLRFKSKEKSLLRRQAERAELFREES
jgi:hypothetical protein